MIKKINLFVLTLCLLALPVMAAENYTLLKPGMGTKWLNEVGVDVTGTLDWLIAGIVVAFFVTFLVYTFFAGMKGFGSAGDLGSSDQKGHGQNAIVTIFGTMLLVVLCIRVGLVFFGWF